MLDATSCVGVWINVFFFLELKQWDKAHCSPLIRDLWNIEVWINVSNSSSKVWDKKVFILSKPVLDALWYLLLILSVQELL